MSTADRNMGSLGTKTGLQGLRNIDKSDEATGPGPAIHPPSQAVTLPVLSKHRGAARFAMGVRSVGPSHNGGPDGGMASREERMWGPGGQLGPGAGPNISSMGRMDPRRQCSGQYFAMGGRRHDIVSGEWHSGVRPGVYAESSGRNCLAKQVPPAHPESSPWPRWLRCPCFFFFWLRCPCGRG